MSLLPILLGEKNNLLERAFFIETGDKLAEIETDDIHFEQIVKQKIGIYRINFKNALLYINPEDEKYIIQTKQKAILRGRWLLAYYPASTYMSLQSDHSNQLVPKVQFIKPYYVLVDLKTGRWTMNLTSRWAQKAPANQLKKELKQFYW